MKRIGENLTVTKINKDRCDIIYYGEEYYDCLLDINKEKGYVFIGLSRGCFNGGHAEEYKEGPIMRYEAWENAK